MRGLGAHSLVLFALAACGRTTAQAVVADAADAAADASGQGAVDTSADTSAAADTDALETDAAAETRPAAPEPRFVLVGTQECPMMGGAEALVLSAPEQALVLVQTKVSDECSGAGGEYFIGAEEGAGDLWLGGHACYFLDPLLRTPSDRIWWGVARVVQTAGLRETPTGWCITSLSGAEPVRSDSSVLAWALYESEAEARAAFAALAR